MTESADPLKDAADAFDELVFAAPTRLLPRSRVRVPAAEAEALIEQMRPLAGGAAQPAFRALADLVASAERRGRTGELVLDRNVVHDALDALRPDSGGFLEADDENDDGTYRFSLLAEGMEASRRTVPFDRRVTVDRDWTIAMADALSQVDHPRAVVLADRAVDLVASAPTFLIRRRVLVDQEQLSRLIEDLRAAI